MTVDLTSIISVSGKSGLFKIIAKARNGLIVESIEDGKRMPVFSTQKVSALEEISVYTTGENISLGELFYKMFEKSNGQPLLFGEEEVMKMRALLNDLISLDNEQVRDHDIKKIFKWFNTLCAKNMLKKKEEGGGASEVKENMEESKQIESSASVERKTSEEETKEKKAEKKKAHAGRSQTTEKTEKTKKGKTSGRESDKTPKTRASSDKKAQGKKSSDKSGNKKSK